jgi:hypothetical protein
MRSRRDVFTDICEKIYRNILSTTFMLNLLHNFSWSSFDLHIIASGDVIVRQIPLSIRNGTKVHFLYQGHSSLFILGVAKRCFKLMGIGILQTAFAAVKSFCT